MSESNIRWEFTNSA